MRFFAGFLPKVPLQQPSQCFAVSRFVSCHLVDGVMDRVEVELFGFLGQVRLAGGGAVFGFYAHFEVFLGGVGDDIAQELSEFFGVLGLLKSGPLPVQADLRIAFPVGDAGHGQVHADFAAFAFKVCPQASLNLFRGILRDADDVLCRPGHLAALLNKLGAGDVADRALCGGIFAFIDITANRTYEFFHDTFLR